MGNKLNPFEEEIKRAASQYEAPYNPQAWEKVSYHLDNNAGSNNLWKWGVGIVAASILAVGGYMLSPVADSDPADNAITQTEAPVKNQEPVSETAPEESNALVTNEENNPASVEESTNSSSSVPSSDNQESITPVAVEENKEAPQVKEEKKEKEVKKTEPKPKKKELVIPVIMATQNHICAGTEFTAKMLTFSPDDELWWDMGNGDKIQGKSISYTYSEPGDYEVKVYSPKSRKLVSNVLHVEVNALPDASFNMYENVGQGGIPVVEFTANKSGLKFYEWSLGDGSRSSGQDVTHTYTKARDYEVTLSVINSNGCENTAVQTFSNPKAYNLLAPTSFSPNGDGVNDEWMPVALTQGQYQFEINVYDRNNNKVFTSTDPDNRFTGRVNGTMANPGDMFIWKATVVDQNGKKQQFGGSIIVMGL